MAFEPDTGRLEAYSLGCSGCPKLGLGRNTPSQRPLSPRGQIGGSALTDADFEGSRQIGLRSKTEFNHASEFEFETRAIRPRSVSNSPRNEPLAVDGVGL